MLIKTNEITHYICCDHIFPFWKNVILMIGLEKRVPKVSYSSVTGIYDR